MSDFIGIKKYCNLCKHSSTNKDDIVCNNNNSKFNGLVVNQVLCAPCIDKKEINQDQVVELISFD